MLIFWFGSVPLYNYYNNNDNHEHTIGIEGIKVMHFCHNWAILLLCYEENIINKGRRITVSYKHDINNEFINNFMGLYTWLHIFKNLGSKITQIFISTYKYTIIMLMCKHTTWPHNVIKPRQVSCCF